jgi:hypothetical protein
VHFFSTDCQSYFVTGCLKGHCSFAFDCILLTNAHTGKTKCRHEGQCWKSLLPIKCQHFLSLFNYIAINNRSNGLGEGKEPFFKAHSQNCEKLRPVCPSVRPSVRMEHLDSHWTDFHEIWYLRIFEKLSRKFTSDKNNGYFTWRPMYCFLSYLTHLFLEWCFRRKF